MHISDIVPLHPPPSHSIFNLWLDAQAPLIDCVHLLLRGAIIHPFWGVRDGQGRLDTWPTNEDSRECECGVSTGWARGMPTRTAGHADEDGWACRRGRLGMPTRTAGHSVRDGQAHGLQARTAGVWCKGWARVVCKPGWPGMTGAWPGVWAWRNGWAGMWPAYEDGWAWRRCRRDGRARGMK